MSKKQQTSDEKEVAITVNKVAAPEAIMVSLEVPKVESVYSLEELAQNAVSVFGQGIKQECVVAALMNEGVTNTTINNAKNIVDKFMKREVK